MDASQVRQKTQQGLKANALRQISVQAMGVITAIVLARYLSPDEFGAYGALSLATQFFTIWGGIGVGFALIRQPEDPTEGELNVAFALQFALSTILCLALGFSAPLIEYSIKPAAAYVDVSAGIWILAACAWLAPLRLIPNVRLQRRIDFVQLAWVEFVETLVYNVTAICLAIAKAGVWALLFATLARAVTGCALLYFVCPWRATRMMDLSRLKQKIMVGLSFESISIISFAKDLALPAFIGATLGLSQLGYYVWARELGTKFVTVSRLYGKVAFPAFSRLAGDHSATRDLLARSFQLLGLFYWPAVISFIAISHPLISLVFGETWLPARAFLILFVLGTLQQIWSSPAWALIQAQSSGRWPLRIVLLMTAFEILAAYPALRLLGLAGAGAVLFLSMLLFTNCALAEIRTSLPASLLEDFLKRALLNGMLLIAGAAALQEWPFGIGSTFIAMAGFCLAAILFNAALFRTDRELVFSIVRRLLPSHADAG